MISFSLLDFSFRSGKSLLVTGLQEKALLEHWKCVALGGIFCIKLSQIRILF